MTRGDATVRSACATPTLCVCPGGAAGDNDVRERGAEGGRHTPPSARQGARDDLSAVGVRAGWGGGWPGRGAQGRRGAAGPLSPFEGGGDDGRGSLRGSTTGAAPRGERGGEGGGGRAAGRPATTNHPATILKTSAPLSTKLFLIPHCFVFSF